MKHIAKISLLFLCMALPAIYACSQPPPPPSGPLLAGPAVPGRTPPPPFPGGPVFPNNPDGPGGRPVRQLIALQGTVGAYTTSDSNAYDGLTLRTAGQTQAVCFAPRLAAQLMAAARTGAMLSILGFYETTPEGRNVIHLVNATAGSQTIYDGPAVKPDSTPTETIQPFTGTMSDLRRDRRGIPNGIVLSGSRIIELPPGVYDQLQAYLKPGTSVSGSGSRLIPPTGVVPAHNNLIIHPHTLTLNGQTYLVR